MIATIPSATEKRPFGSPRMAFSLSIMSLAGILFVDFLQIQAGDSNGHSQREAAGDLTAMVFMFVNVAIVAMALLSLALGIATLIKNLIERKKVYLPAAAILVSGITLGIAATRFT